MAEAMHHGYKVLKPWGESASFDVALYFGARIVRVQVKSTSCASRREIVPGLDRHMVEAQR